MLIFFLVICLFDLQLIYVVSSVRDLGILVSHDLSPTLHISSIVCNAHKRSAAIYRVFVCRNVDLLVRAYLTYVRPLVEHDSVIWSPYTFKDIEHRICPASIHKEVALSNDSHLKDVAVDYYTS